MEYSVKIADVKAGDVLIPDGGFTCIKVGTPLTVEHDNYAGPWVPCSHGRHFLAGQVDDSSQTYVGFVKQQVG